MKIARTFLTATAAALLAGPALAAGLNGDLVHIEARNHWDGSLIAQKTVPVGSGVELNFSSTRYFDMERHIMDYAVDVHADGITITIDAVAKLQGYPHPLSIPVLPNRIDLVVSNMHYNGSPLGTVTVGLDEYVSTQAGVGGVELTSGAHDVAVHFPWFQGGGFEYGMTPGTHRTEILVGEGSSVGYARYPWLVSIRGNGNFVGHGVLVRKGWVLTTAHVAEAFPVAQLSVVAGDKDIFSPDPTEVISAVSQKEVNPDYNNPQEGTYSNDIALLRLSSALQMSAQVQTIELPSGSSDFTGDIVTMVGHTVFPFGGEIESYGVVLSNAAAQAHLNGQATLGDSHIAILGEELYGAPKSDPFIAVENGQEVVAGLFSFGASAGGVLLQSYPYVGQRVSSHLNWIRGWIGGPEPVLNVDDLGQANDPSARIAVVDPLASAPVTQGVGGGASAATASVQPYYELVGAPPSSPTVMFLSLTNAPSTHWELGGATEYGAGTLVPGGQFAMVGLSTDISGGRVIAFPPGSFGFTVYVQEMIVGEADGYHTLTNSLGIFLP